MGLTKATEGTEISKVDFNEFMIMMEHDQTNSDKNAELRHVFAIFDKNGDGYISKYKLKISVC